MLLKELTNSFRSYDKISLLDLDDNVLFVDYVDSIPDDYLYSNVLSINADGGLLSVQINENDELDFQLQKSLTALIEYLETCETTDPHLLYLLGRYSALNDLKRGETNAKNR